ncbi:hypothetical protein [Flavobacterium orientale]|nr:hypothetical protein [Flavobacterium orientale]
MEELCGSVVPIPIWALEKNCIKKIAQKTIVFVFIGSKIGDSKDTTKSDINAIFNPQGIEIPFNNII